jgi:hypothetical protein
VGVFLSTGYAIRAQTHTPIHYLVGGLNGGGSSGSIGGVRLCQVNQFGPPQMPGCKRFGYPGPDV